MSKQITIGKNGFIFFNSHSSKKPNALIKSVCGITSLSKKFLVKSKTYLSDFVNYTRSFGIQAHIAIIPTKTRIYPEYLPTLENQWCQSTENTWRDSFLEALSNHIVYYPLKLMRNLKSSIQVYLPKYFHWQGQTPNLVAIDIIENLWGLNLQFDISPRKLNIKTDLRLLLKGLHFYDESYFFDYAKKGVVSCSGAYCLKGIKKYYENPILNTFKRKGNDLKLVLISDSFGKHIAADFSLGFADVIHIDANNLKPEEQFGLYKWIVTDIKPTHLLYLFHDGGLYGQTLLLERLMNDIKNNTF